MVSGDHLYRLSFLPQARFQIIRHHILMDVSDLRTGCFVSARKPPVKRQKFHIPRPCLHRYYFLRRISVRRHTAQERTVSLELRKFPVEYRQHHPPGLCTLLVHLRPFVRTSFNGKRQALRQNTGAVKALVHIVHRQGTDIERI